MRRLACALPLAIVAFAFARGQTTPKQKPLLIVFDDWWNVDYVKNGCELSAQNGNPCPSDRTPPQ